MPFSDAVADPLSYPLLTIGLPALSQLSFPSKRLVALGKSPYLCIVTQTKMGGGLQAGCDDSHEIFETMYNAFNTITTMAKLLTKKYQNTNEQSKAFGKYYGRIVHTETLSTDEFASHISSHGSPYDRSTIHGVLMAACDCLVELTLDSKRVRLSDLGTFYMSAETEGANEEKEFTAGNIKKVHLRFLPNMKKSYPLDSVSIRKQAKFADLERLLNGSKTGDSADGGDSGGGDDGGGSDSGGDEPRP